MKSCSSGGLSNPSSSQFTRDMGGGTHQLSGKKENSETNAVPGQTYKFAHGLRRQKHTFPFKSPGHQGGWPVSHDSKVEQANNPLRLINKNRTVKLLTVWSGQWGGRAVQQKPGTFSHWISPNQKLMASRSNFPRSPLSGGSTWPFKDGGVIAQNSGVTPFFLGH